MPGSTTAEDQSENTAEGSSHRNKHGTTPSQQESSSKPTNTESDRSASTTSNQTGMPLQRALSAPRQSAASIDGVIEGTRDRLAKNGTSSPSWPTSPRLKSPPPPNTSRSHSRRDSSEQAQSNTAKRLAPVSAPDLAAAMLLSEGSKEQIQAQGQAQSTAQARAPPRGTTGQTSALETVVEGSLPSTPSVDPKADPMTQSTTSSISAKNESSAANSSTNQSDSNKHASNKTENDSKSRAASTSKHESGLAKRSFTSLTGSKKPVAEPVRTLTVETEPVVTSTTGLGERRGDGGSVRTKTSTETIRPKKEKKRPVRKTGTLHAGTLASKADIFEAKVASAVDEADTDDSEETFVYESNPPDPRSYRHHSRTPSATSLASTHDLRGAKHGLRSGSTAISGKKSMKFSNNTHNREHDDDPSRSGVRNASSTPRPHHIGRYNRNPHPSVLTDDSPFGAQSKNPISPRNLTGTFRSSKPASPRVAGGRITSPRKYAGSAYDNGEDIADDERAPLVGTVRISRNRHSRRPNSRDFRSMEMGDDLNPSCWSRCGGWLLLIVLLIFICTGVAAFAMAISKPLYDVEIHRITNVLASEQELMLDLDVKAVNPNLFAITVTDLDVNLFAESPYVSTSKEWHKHHTNPGLRTTISERRKRGWFWPDPHPDDGVDEGTDPDDPEGVQKMLLGRVFEFDSPLMFEPAPVRRTSSSSTGEIRLAKPGNKTEVGGSERWERVLLHDFDIIVRGVIKYQLPLSSKVRSAKIGGRKLVHPDGEDKKAGIHS
ncbi:Vacuolar inheritance and morphology protein [Lithohypha guttulata]|uniref:Vacuolar inheritance and morphology protein n=1 Tax=Lithohypha guttulata TaxID=1690604 RepID=UPI002DE0FD0C|nr:Vacuolar inheritance and morphology protein [Lithohypha guttulata]